MIRKIWPFILVALSTLTTAARASQGQADWKVGAGVSFVGLVSTQPFVGSSALGVGTPTVVANLEHRFAGGLWFTLGVDASISTLDNTVTGLGQTQTEVRTNTISVAVSPGLRKVLTAEDAPLEVSVLGELQLGLARTSSDPGSSGGVTLTAHAFHGGLGGGFAVERRLLEGLSVRAAVRLAAAGYDRATTEAGGQSLAKSEGFSVALAVAPSLEMRFAF
jgi:hypothetical protein